MKINTVYEFLSKYLSKMLTKRSNGDWELNVSDAGDNALVACVTDGALATTNETLDACVTGNVMAVADASAATLAGCVTADVMAVADASAATLAGCVTDDAVATTNAILDVALGTDANLTANVTTAAKTASFTPAASGGDYIITLGQAGHATLTSGDTISISQDGYGIVTVAGTTPTGGPLAFSALGRFVAALIGGVAVNVVLTGENGGTDVTVRADRVVR